MSTLQRMIGMVLRPLAERQARGRSGEAFAADLERSGRKVQGRFERAEDTPGNREAVNHIVGIERWGQRRLRVALGEPPVSDAYRGYRLPEGADLKALAQAFTETRRETVRLALELGRADPGLKTRVAHNDLGELSVGGWLAYLGAHASREQFRVRG